jgi:hypothetical protein
MSTSDVPIDSIDAARDPHMPLSTPLSTPETKPLSISREQESAFDVKIGPEDVDHPVKEGKGSNLS